MTEALTIDQKSRFRPINPRKPIKELDDRGLKLVEAMTFGVDPDEAAALGVAPYKPLPLELAADASGLKRRNARWIFTQPVFLTAYSKALASVRSSHKARAVSTMAAIMDDPGEGLAADRTVRLKAAQAIMGDEGRAGGTSVNVQINNSTTQLAPGVVIRLPANVSAPPLELQRADDDAPLELTANDQHEEPRGLSSDPSAEPTMSRAWPRTTGGDE